MKQMWETKNTIQQKNRWNDIDLIEFLGMLFVVTYHATTYSFSWLEEHRKLYYLRYYLRTILSTCTPLFFFANGYLLFNKEFDLKKHIYKIIKIIVLTEIWGIFTMLLFMLIDDRYIYSVKEFMLYLSNWSWVNHLWYMGALVCIYIFFPLLKSAYDVNRKLFVYFIIICFVMTFGNTLMNHICTIAQYIKGNAQNIYLDWFNMFNPFRGIFGYTIVYFCVGGIAHNYRGKILEVSKRKRNIISILTIFLNCTILFVLGLLISKNDEFMWDVIWNGHDTIFTLLNVCAIWILSLSYTSPLKTIRIISCNTLGIYFIHVIVIHFLGKYIKYHPFIGTYLGCLFYSLVIIIISLVITLIIGKIPLMKNLLNLNYSRQHKHT